MRHVRAAALDALEPLLQRLRSRPALTERPRSVFYLKSRPFLHFHEDAAGLYADMKSSDAGDFVRSKIDGLQAQERLLARLDALLGARSERP